MIMNIYGVFVKVTVCRWFLWKIASFATTHCCLHVYFPNFQYAHGRDLSIYLLFSATFPCNFINAFRIICIIYFVRFHLLQMLHTFLLTRLFRFSHLLEGCVQSEHTQWKMMKVLYYGSVCSLDMHCILSHHSAYLNFRYFHLLGTILRLLWVDIKRIVPYNSRRRFS